MARARACSVRSEAPENQIAVIYGDGAIQRGSEGINPFSAPGSAAMTSDDMVEAFKSGARGTTTSAA